MSKIYIKNKKASLEYELFDKFVAGIVLKGTEIKSIRNNKVSMSDSYCSFINNELWMKNLHISEYKTAGLNNHDPKRERKLLLNRKELEKISRKVKIKGMTIIPITLFINEKGKAKLEVAIGKGKKLFDKRESLKEKDTKRELDRLNKKK